jgi:hypothetical protein
MRTTLTFLLALATLHLQPALSSAGEPATSPLTATWELLSSKCGDDSAEAMEAPKDRRKVKLINGTHFVWAEYERATGKLLGLAGGTAQLKGSTYTEKIEFASDGMEALVGKVFSFEIKIENGRLLQQGMLGENMKLSEVWGPAAGAAPAATLSQASKP